MLYLPGAGFSVSAGMPEVVKPISYPVLILLPDSVNQAAAWVHGLREQAAALGAACEFAPAIVGDWRTQLQTLAQAQADCDLIWLRRADLCLAGDTLERLLKAARQADGPVLAMSNSEHALSPAAPDSALSAEPPETLDDAVFALGNKRLYPVEAQNPPLLALAQGSDASAQAQVLDHLYAHDPALPVTGLPTPADRRERQPAHPLAALRSALHAAQARGALGQQIWSRATRDHKPVLLHLLHGWGGGAERFVRDLATVDDARVHLLLRATGSASRARHGEALELSDARGGPLLRCYPMHPGIGAVADQHAGYAASLARICGEFNVEALVVSSLIGHSIDALRCGLPVVWIAHDYFPFWPCLHRDFGSADAVFDDTSLERDLEQERSSPFAERAAPFWRGIRASTVNELLKAKARIVGPSRSVLDNLQRIVPELQPLARECIGHGLAPWPDPIAVEPDPDPSRRLRLVVVGRIHGGKGLDLLRQVLPEMGRSADIFLVGSGKSAEALFGVSGVHIRLNYERDELPRILAQIRPDAALMAPTVAETFSYTLSELWSMGVVPAASRLGALAERIEDGRTGFLFSPEPDALLAMVARLDRDRALLQSVRRHIAEQTPRTLQAMLADYSSLLPVGERTTLRYQIKTAGLEDAGEAVLEDALLDHRVRLQQAQQRLGEQESELVRRAEWGFSLARMVDDRTVWARSLDAELARTRQWLSDREAVYQRSIATEQSRRMALESSLSELQGEMHRVMEEAKAVRDALHARQLEVAELGQTLDQRQSDLDQVQAQAQALHAAHEALQAEQQALLQARERLQQEHDDLARLRDGLLRERDAVIAHREQMLQSTSWRVTWPLRAVGFLLKRARASAKFRMRRLLSLLGRARGSLARHGVRGTLARIRSELTRADAPAVASVQLAEPVQEEHYEAYAIATSESPLVSVVVPVYNQLHHTWQCLRALADTVSATPIEVIVVDDGSSDRTADEVPRISGVRFHRNGENLGFIGACNAGAELARGRYLFFLNNDTAVQPGWLEPLLACYREFDQVGLVGSKLVYPDGRLQEAGGIVFNDGSGWNYGRFDHPDDPRYDYPREADYCSGAAILIEKALFDRFGGFDAHYRPAYYEDTDLAFKVRAAGLRVMVQPASRVIHYEGVTGGTDTGSGTKRFQVINQSKFRERWAEALNHQPAPTDHAGIWRAATHRATGRILLIDATTPTPDQDSGSVRYINLVRVLRSLGWQCTFFADNRAYVPGYSEALRALGVEVQFHPWIADPVEFFRQRGTQFDAIVLSRHYVARHYVDLAREYAPQARILFDTVDLHYLREQRAAVVAASDAMARQAEHTRAAELDLIARCDVTLVVSTVEQELLHEAAPGRRIEVLSNIHELAGCRRGYAEREGLWFVGGFQHQPNVDAVLWFVGEIWPLIRRQLPDAVFHVVGSKMPTEIASLQGNGVQVHGFVSDIETFLDGCRLAVAPLRYGAGVKGKVNQSMAYGQPVVATPIAVEGMAVVDGDAALVREDPESFASAVVMLYRDADLWQRLSIGGLANIQQHFSFEAARSNLQRILSQEAIDSRQRAR